MEKFDRLESAAAPLNMANVDTDQIIPARFLWRARSDGYGELLFNDLRANDDGVPKPDFVLNKPVYKDARIIVGDRNFGCGSSREHAAVSYTHLDVYKRQVLNTRKAGED